ncbi:MAG TPA: phosphatidylglycerophosphatase A [Candidatus Binatia bacterium]
MDKIFKKVVLLLVTGAGIGYIPRLPGTVGTIIAIPFSLALNRIALSNFLVATVLLIGSVAGAVWLCSQFAGMLNQKDPQLIVIDEIVGFLVGNFLAPFSLTALLWSFALFRFFDISKIFPANRLERLQGGAGIVLDDVMAGLYTFASLRLLLKLGWV